jgi:tetratricopeptide (TPR) repeat protein
MGGRGVRKVTTILLFACMLSALQGTASAADAGTDATAESSEYRMQQVPQPHYASAQAYNHYLLGQLLEISGRLPEALEQYRLAVVHDPGVPYLHLVLSSAQARMFNIRGAISQAEASVEIDPSFADGYIYLGLLHRMLGEFEQSEAALKNAVSADPKRIDAYIELSRVLLLQSRDKDAESVFQMMITNMPENPAGYFEMGRVYFDKRLIEKAEPYLRKAIEKDPAFFPAAFTLSEGLELQTRFKEAIKVLEALHRYIGDDQDLMMRLGRLAFKSGDSAGADRYFDHLRRSAYSEVETRLKLAAFYMEEGERELAMKELDSLYRQFPEKDSVRYWKGLAHEELKQYEAAYRLYEKMPRSSGLHADSMAHAAYCQLKMGHPQRAIKMLKPFIDTEDPSPLSFYVLSQAWGEVEDKSEGISFFGDLLKKYPDNLDVVEALSALQEKAGDVEGARRTVESVLSGARLAPVDRERMMLLIAMILERAGSSDGALAMAREVLRLNPDSPEALNFVGYTMAEKGTDLPTAEAMVKRALLFKPSSGYITDSLGWVYFMTGQYDKAIGLLERADKLSPEEPEILAHVGDTLVKLKRPGEAIEKYRKALKCKPDKKIREELTGKIRELEGSR